MAEFPVLMTGTTKWVVWVDAADAAEAHEMVQADPHEWVEKQQPVDAWIDAEKDPDETAYFVWMYSSDVMPRHDAHVQMHQAVLRRQKLDAERAACAEAGHPETEEPLSDGRAWCKGCSEYLPAEAVRRG